MKSFVFAFAALLLQVNLAAQSEMPEPKLTFEASNLFSDVPGRFEQFEYDITFDPTDPATTKISGQADVASINTGNETRDADLQAESWFDADDHPVITVRSESVKRISGNDYEGVFIFKIKGIQVKRTLPFRVIRKSDYYLLTATFIIDTDNFNVTGGTPGAVVDDDVKVTVALPFR